MAARTLVIDRPIDEIWPRLQRLATWEDIGGMHDLRNAVVDDAGNLTGFAFSIETPIGDIRDRADVSTRPPDSDRRSQPASLTAVADSKGIRVTVSLSLTPGHDDTTTAEFAIEGRSTNFLTKPLVGTLRDTLESGIDREGARLASRLTDPKEPT